MPDSIRETTDDIQRFVDERDWRQFHDPKSLAASICIEAGELMEKFQWLRTREETENYVEKHLEEIADEIADVAAYLFELSDNLGIDLLEAIKRKRAKNASKYPVEKTKGRSDKYDTYINDGGDVRTSFELRGLLSQDVMIIEKSL